LCDQSDTSLLGVRPNHQDGSIWTAADLYLSLCTVLLCSYSNLVRRYDSPLRHDRPSFWSPITRPTDPAESCFRCSCEMSVSYPTPTINIEGAATATRTRHPPQCRARHTVPCFTSSNLSDHFILILININLDPNLLDVFLKLFFFSRINDLGLFPSGKWRPRIRCWQHPFVSGSLKRENSLCSANQVYASDMRIWRAMPSATAILCVSHSSDKKLFIMHPTLVAGGRAIRFGQEDRRVCSRGTYRERVKVRRA